MNKKIKTADRPGVLIPAVEEVPRISDGERDELRASLQQARAEIADGDYDVLTPEILRAEFDAIYYDGKSDAEIDAELASKGIGRRAKSA